MNINVTWGDNHKKSFSTYEQAKEFAYEQEFYFSDVKINGILQTRIL